MAAPAVQAGEMTEIPSESATVADNIVVSSENIEAKIAECETDLQSGLDLMLLGRIPSALDRFGAEDDRFLAVIYFESKVTEMLEVVGSYRAYDFVIQEIGNYCTRLRPTVWPPGSSEFIPHPLALLSGS